MYPLCSYQQLLTNCLLLVLAAAAAAKPDGGAVAVSTDVEEDVTSSSGLQKRTCSCFDRGSNAPLTSRDLAKQRTFQMLPLNSLRIACSSPAALQLTRQMTKRLPVSTTPGRLGPCMCTGVLSKDVTAGAKKKSLIDHTSANSATNYCTGQVRLHCWNCHHRLDNKPAFFCVSCNVVQPPEEQTSYFQIMGCDYTFTLDTHKLQRRYLQLQRALHPDNFSQKCVKEQEYSESQSALVNKAYKTLLKPLSRGLYMLKLEGLCIEEGTESRAESEFLTELMEINEALDEARTPEEADEIGRDTKDKLAELTEQIDAALHKGELQAARTLLTQMKYYANIEEKVKEKLSKFM